jgi:hypothetical protein
LVLSVLQEKLAGVDKAASGAVFTPTTTTAQISVTINNCPGSVLFLGKVSFYHVSFMHQTLLDLSLLRQARICAPN